MKNNKSQKGASLIELAMALPMLVTMLAGTFQIGGAMTAYSTLNRVAYEIARVASRERSVNQDVLMSKAQAILSGHGMEAGLLHFELANSQQNQPISIEVSIPAPHGAIFKLFSIERLKVNVAAPRLYNVMSSPNGSSQQ